MLPEHLSVATGCPQASKTAGRCAFSQRLGGSRLVQAHRNQPGLSSTFAFSTSEKRRAHVDQRFSDRKTERLTDTSKVDRQGHMHTRQAEKKEDIDP